jgi:hypothetical protein
MAGDGARGVSEVGLSILARRPKLMGLVVFTCVAALHKKLADSQNKTKNILTGSCLLLQSVGNAI